MRIAALWRVAVIGSALLAVGALGAAGWFGIRWYGEARVTSTEAVQARDAALKAARDLAVTLQTINPGQPEAGLDAWEAAATGDLLDQLQRDRGKHLDQMRSAPSISNAVALETALTELDVSSGTATAISAVDVTQITVVNNRPQPATVRKLRVTLTLSMTDAGWKVAGSSLLPA